MLLLATLAASAPAAGQALERRLVVVVPEAGDARVAHTRAAVAFWNRTLADLGLDVRLREAALVVDSPDMRGIETFARFVSQRGGRIPRGRDGPQPPPELIALGGDVVVLLSRQPLMPFAWPLIGSPDHLVAIRTLRPRRLRDDTVLRNVIAHELGHTPPRPCTWWRDSRASMRKRSTTKQRSPTRSALPTHGPSASRCRQTSRGGG